ncbi:hypothetical protein C8R43DRAFT_947997 [Mycena crocata]|nr:hypothetical protein C8R43DRAFT_947997 [Mycena crocata]
MGWKPQMVSAWDLEIYNRKGQTTNIVPIRRFWNRSAKVQRREEEKDLKEIWDIPEWIYNKWDIPRDLIQEGTSQSRIENVLVNTNKSKVKDIQDLGVNRANSSLQGSQAPPKKPIFVLNIEREKMSR